MNYNYGALKLKLLPKNSFKICHERNVFVAYGRPSFPVIFDFLFKGNEKYLRGESLGINLRVNGQLNILDYLC